MSNEPSPPEVIVSLLENLIRSASEQSGRPRMPEGGRAPLRAWLKRALLDWDHLFAHICLLRRCLGNSTSLNGSLASCRTEEVLRGGLVALDEFSLAALAVNPSALLLLYEEIQKRGAKAWEELPEIDGEQLMAQFGVTLDMLTGKAPLPPHLEMPPL
jgi:hypothetical protein